MKNKLFASVPNILFGALIAIAPQTFLLTLAPAMTCQAPATTRSRPPPASAS